jgi:hypothetical protein
LIRAFLGTVKQAAQTPHKPSFRGMFFAEESLFLCRSIEERFLTRRSGFRMTASGGFSAICDPVPANNSTSITRIQHPRLPKEAQFTYESNPELCILQSRA